MAQRGTFDQRIETARQSLKALLESSGGSPEQHAMAAEALEDLVAAGEELRQQNEELNAARQTLEVALQVEAAGRRRAAEEAESQTRFPTENPNPVMRLSQEGTLLYANEGSAPLLAEWGCAPGGLVPPFWRDQVAEVLVSQATKTVDVPCGEQVYSFFVVPIGPAGYVNLYGRDITLRKLAEEEREQLLLEARQLTAELEAIFDAQADAILIYDTAMNVRRANPPFLATYGFDPVGLNVKDIISRVSCRDLDGRPTQWQAGPTPRALKGEKVAGAFFLVKRADGTEAVVRTSSGPMCLEDRIAGSVTVWHDITALKQAEDQLQFQNEELQAQAEELQTQADELHAQALNLAEERARLQAIIDSAPEAILVADERGQVVLANPAAERLFAAPGTGTVGLEHYAKVTRYNPDHAPVDPQHLPLFRAAALGETHRNMPLALLWPDGEWRDVLASAVPIRDERGQIYGAVSVYQDITERVRAESQRDAMLEQVEAALAEKEVLMREIYHRVKNNVQALIYLMGMQAEYISDEPTRQMIHELQERARTMALVHEKLYQSQNLAQIDFGDYLHDLVDNLSRAFRDGRPIVWHINAESVLLGVDTAIPCGLIVNELLTNALKYAFPGNHPCMERGETECEIRVDFRADGEHLTLIVGDNGIGLPPGLDRKTTGSLGLQLINILAEYQLGGQVEVDTQAGTTFRITFTERKK
jgi:PAS domain S-box-containing protein